MSEINKYRIWCITDSAYVYVWGTEEPTSCPVSSSHVIDPSKTVIEETIEDSDVIISPLTDESGRPLVRADSRDLHDTTYFTCKGDTWTTVLGGAIGNGDGSTTDFSFPNGIKEVKSVKIYVDGTETTEVTVDKTSYDSTLNQHIHFGDGTIEFDVAPTNGSAITADYTYGTIATGNKYMYEQSIDGDTKTIDVSFIDPVHIKDGLVIFEGGAIDSKLNLYAVCPQYGTYLDDRLPATGVYADDNGNYLPALTGAKVVAHYVVDQILLGVVHVGLYFDIEARSVALPPGYIMRAVIDAGSATDLKMFARLEINRERTALK